MKILLATPLLATLLLFAPQGYSQGENLYQIEVIVFERPSQENVDGSELWPKSIELSYPKNLAALIDPGKEADAKAREVLESSRASSFSLSEEFLDSLKADQSATEDAPGSDAATAAQQSEASASTPAEGIDKESAVRLNTFLPAEFKRLNDKKSALQQRMGYRVLFHETWLQALVSPTKAPALPISGGNAYAEHQELEGYIKLSLNRYLHFETNLWLTEFVANFGQPQEHWPRLPKPFAVTEEESAPQWQETAAPSNGAYIPGTGMQAGVVPDSKWTSGEVDPYADLLEAPYLIKSIAAMQQKRRMRSSELHYLDHPKLGVLVKIEPAKPQQ